MTTKALAALITAIGVLAGGLPAAAQGPIRIGASLSLTGTYAKLGNYQNEGYKLCAKQANEHGGLLGRKIEFVVYDDQSAPSTAVRLYEKLITEASANVTEKYKKVMVTPLAATTSIFKRPPDKKRYYLFMVISPAEAYLEGLVDMAAKRGLKTIAIVNEDTLFAKAAGDGAAELANKRGMQVVFREGYPKGNQDFSAILTKIRAANPEVLAASTYFDDAIAITRQMKELNVNPKMYGITVGGDLPEFYDLLKQNAEYITGATQWETTLPYPGNREFSDAYKKEFGREPVYHSAAGYAGCVIYLEAVKRAATLPIASAGAPVGLMVVGGHGADRRLLAVARGIETALA